LAYNYKVIVNINYIRYVINYNYNYKLQITTTPTLVYIPG